MENPLKIKAVSTEVVGDGLSVFDHEQKQSYVLNATSALVFQHCDGQTSPQQLTELLRRKLNVPPAEAEKLMRLALDELRTAGLLQSSGVAMPPPAATYSRREALTSFAALGFSLALMPMVARVAEAHGGGKGHGNGNGNGHGNGNGNGNGNGHGGGDGHGGHDDDDDGHGGQGGGHKLIPLLECVDDNGDGTYTAHFGYLNQSGATINLAVGPKNMFVPGQQDYGQPTVFLPGEHLNVFSVVFPGTEDLKWMLKANGDRRHQVVASAEFEACTTMSPTTPPTSTQFSYN